MKASNFKLSICPSENYFSGAHRNQRTFTFGGGKYHYIDGLQFHKHASLHTNNNMKNRNFAMDTDNCVAPPYTTCLLVLLAKLATSHVLQSNKNKTFRGRGKRLTVSIA